MSPSMMPTDLTADQTALARTAEEFARFGVLGLPVPKEHGGEGLTLTGSDRSDPGVDAGSMTRRARPLLRSNPARPGAEWRPSRRYRDRP
jgi:hypothetical protein